MFIHIHWNQRFVENDTILETITIERRDKKQCIYTGVSVLRTELVVGVFCRLTWLDSRCSLRISQTLSGTERRPQRWSSWRRRCTCCWCGCNSRRPWRAPPLFNTLLEAFGFTCQVSRHIFFPNLLATAISGTGYLDILATHLLVLLQCPPLPVLLALWTLNLYTRAFLNVTGSNTFMCAFCSTHLAGIRSWRTLSAQMFRYVFSDYLFLTVLVWADKLAFFLDEVCP